MQEDIRVIYNTLYEHYGDLAWWPADTPYEVMLGAILTQNTNWKNVELALANLEGNLTPEYIETIELDELTKLIRPAGFFNQKALYLKEMTLWFKRYNYDINTVRQEPLDKLRHELLNVRGIGPETADSILLYAFNLETFVIDAYTKRIFYRYGLDLGSKYEDLRRAFMESLPKDVEIYNHYHGLIVEHAKTHCKKKPICTGCPLLANCERRGLEAIV